MKRIIVTLDYGAVTKEVHIRVPKDVVDKMNQDHMRDGIEAMFKESGIEVVQVEVCEEVRHEMSRRWDDSMEKGSTAPRLAIANG